MHEVRLDDIDEIEDIGNLETLPQKRIILLDQILDETSGVVSPPDVCLKLEALMRDPSSSVDAFADVIMLDPNLTGQVLKLANGAHLGFRGRIDTVTRAVAVLGTNEVLALAYTAHAISSFSRSRSNAIDLRLFWQHAAYVALIARAIAREKKVLHPERLFVAGMLHDLGMAILGDYMPETYRKLLREAEGSERKLAKLERAMLGFDHAALGAALLDEWGLPQTLCDAVRWHHDEACASAQLEAAILYLSDTLAAEFGANFTAEARQPETLALGPMAMIGVDPDFDHYQYFDEVSPDFIEMIFSLMN